MKRKLLFIILFPFIIAIVSQCSDTDTRELNTTKSVEASPTKRQKSINLKSHAPLPALVKSPKDNVSNSKKIELGKLLFFDPILSGSKDIACATCHHPNHGYAEYRDLSIGTNGKGLGSKRAFNRPNNIPIMKRNAHTILNTAFNGMDSLSSYDPETAPMFWDLRVTGLEKQALEPILGFEEMRGNRYSKVEILGIVVKRLKRIPKYVALFKAAFEASHSNVVNEQNIGKAIAAFERTLITTETRFDRYMRGEKNAISLSEKNGFKMFEKVGCGNCHKGPMFSDYKSHTLGIPRNEKLTEFDKGLDDEYAFRTPSLRNLRFTAPYMHNGKFNTLKEVLEFYEDIAKGKNRHEDVAREQLDPLIDQLTLSVKEIGPIVSFLNTLNDSGFDKEIPETVPSGLPVGGKIK